MYCAPPQSHCAAVVVDDDDNYINNNDDDDDEDYKLNAIPNHSFIWHIVKRRIMYV